MPKIIPIQKPVLISKTQNVSISAFESIKNEYQNVKIPKLAEFFDIVKVINKHGNPVDIITFRKISTEKPIGNIVRRYFIEQLPLCKKITQKDYKYQSKNTETKNEILNRQVITTIRQGGAEPKYIDETQVVLKNDDKLNLYIKRIESDSYLPGFNTEKQSLYHYKKEGKQKGYEIGPYLRTKDSYFDLTPFTYRFENFAEESIDQLIHDRYFPLHLYSFQEFKKIAPSVASHPEHKMQYSSDIVWGEDMPKCAYSMMITGEHRNQSTIKLNSTLNNNRATLIHSAAQAQELAYMHALSNETAYNYLTGQSVLQPVTSFGEYCRALSLAQKTEQARIAGDLAVKEYEKSIAHIKDEFPKIPDSLINAK